MNNHSENNDSIKELLHKTSNMFSGLIVKSCNSASSTTEHCSSKIMRTLTKSANNREKFSSGGYKRASARQNVIILADETLAWARIGRQRLTLGTSFFFFFLLIHLFCQTSTTRSVFLSYF